MASESDHARLIAVAQRWEQLAADKDAEIAALKADLEALAEDWDDNANGYLREIARLRGALQALCEIDDAFAAHTKGCAFLNCATCNEHAMKQEYAFMDAKELLGAPRVAAGTALGQENE